MPDLESVIKQYYPDQQIELLLALKIIADAGLFSACARASTIQLVSERMDSEDEVAIVKEVRNIRQTNRILLGLEESALQLTKGLT
jgi:hypothetical protein